MAKTKKKIYIVGNWKMNPQTFDEAKRIYSKTNNAASKTRKVAVVACVPSVYIGFFGRGAKKHAKIGSQDVSTEYSGSFTGSVSAPMVKGLGAG